MSKPDYHSSSEEYLAELKAKAESGNQKAKELFIQTRLAELAFANNDQPHDPNSLMMQWNQSGWSEVLRHLIDTQEETTLHFLQDPNNDARRDEVWELIQKQIH